MSEHTPRRRWIKLWTQETLYGTTKTELLPDERGVWLFMMCMAGDSIIPGCICIDENLAYTDEQVIHILNIPMELYQRTLKKLMDHKKIHKNGTGIIEIINFKKYQPFDKTEYMRTYMQTKRGKSKNDNDK